MEGCLLAARCGYGVLQAGGSALDAAVAAARVLEDDPRFNAGTGSCLTADGEVEMDASIMEGRTLGVGAVALVRTAKNPVRLARAVMEHTPHVLLAAEGAARLLRELGLPQVSPAQLVTPRALARWAAGRAGAPRVDSGGTIGVVALDGTGSLAAATSTGGMNCKLPGRIGDSAIPGAGTFADDEAGAASATGHGEMILRVGLTRVACDLMRQGADAASAARSALARLERVGGRAGLIAIDRAGRVGWAFNTERMSRAFVDASGNEGVGFGPDTDG
jgi:L-asparaginase / beta-aspartyl-peptidase